VNQNGVFEFLGLGGFFFGYFARFKWPSPEKRTTLAFQPITNNLKLFGQALIGAVVSLGRLHPVWVIAIIAMCLGSVELTWIPAPKSD
jgi:hypothetical protein